MCESHNSLCDLCAADKQAAGQLPPTAPVAAAPEAASSTSATTAEAPLGEEQELPLDQSMVHGLAAVLAVAVPACMTNARKKVGVGGQPMAGSRLDWFKHTGCHGCSTVLLHASVCAVDAGCQHRAFMGKASKAKQELPASSAQVWMHCAPHNSGARLTTAQIR